MNKQPPILFANSFPFSLIRRPLHVEPRSLDELRNVLATRPFISCWGHADTVHQASEILRRDIRPKEERPAIHLDDDNYPLANGRQCRECWLLSPCYRPGFRPAPNNPVKARDITGWQVLQLQWV